jgi:Flp pilus assembly protein TadG
MVTTDHPEPALARVKDRFRRLRNDDGQAVVELALAIPLLLLVLFAIIQFGQGIAYYNDETNLANLAARYATVGSTPMCDGVANSITDYVKCEGAKESSVLTNATTCVADPGGNSTATIPAGDPIQVKVSVPFDLTGNLPILSGIPANITISSSATMRAESAITTASSTFTPNIQTTAC